MKKEWTVPDLLSTSSAYWRGCALQAGVRLEIFSVLDIGQMNTSEVADKIQADKRGTEHLLDALSAMGLLVKDSGMYKNSVPSAEYLAKKSPHYIGHIILHHHHVLDGWIMLHEAVKNGEPIDQRSFGEEVERESFLMGMFNLAMAIAPKVAEDVDLSNRKRLLDLGGGPGTYAIHFCKSNPSLDAVIFDRPTTEPFARSTVEKFALSDRIDFVGGDFNTDPISGGPYDVAWLSHILHSNGPQECQEILNKTARAMVPGGIIIIHEFVLNNTKDGPEFPALFSLNMLVNNSRGRSYSEEELFTMLESAGAKNIRRHSFKGPNDSALISGVI